MPRIYQAPVVFGYVRLPSIEVARDPHNVTEVENKGGGKWCRLSAQSSPHPHQRRQQQRQLESNATGGQGLDVVAALERRAVE